MEKKYFTVEEAAQYINRKPGTLRNWRCAGKGPKAHTDTNGKSVFYLKEDLDLFMGSK